MELILRLPGGRVKHFRHVESFDFEHRTDTLTVRAAGEPGMLVPPLVTSQWCRENNWRGGVEYSRRDSDDVINDYTDLGFAMMCEMGGAVHDPDGTGRWDYRASEIADWIETWVPPNQQCGLFIDWEQATMGIAKQRKYGLPGDELTPDELTEQHVTLIDFVRQIRPMCNVGVYAAPTHGPHEDEDGLQWREAIALRNDNLKASGLLDHVTFGLSEAYCFNPDWERNLPRYLALVEDMLRVLPEDKPAGICVMHRYHNSSKNHGFSLIDPDEFKNYITQLFNVRAYGRKLDFVMAWASDQYHYDAGFMLDENGQYANQGETWDRIRTNYVEELIRYYNGPPPANPFPDYDDAKQRSVYQTIGAGFREAVSSSTV